MKNKFYFLLYCDRSSSNIYNSHKFLIEELNKKLKNFYLLNYYYLNNSKENFKPEKKNKKFKIFEPKDFNELKNFSSNKNVVCILINNFGNNLPSISTNFIFKKLKFKVSLLKDIPTINQEDKLIFTKIFQSLKYKIVRLLTNKFESFLRATNLLPKYEIFFLSNYEKFKKIEESLIFKFGLSSFKKIELINSRNYDNLKKKNPELSKKFIVLLDDFFDHPSSLKLRGKIPYKIVKKHYKLLNIFLVKMQKTLKKK